MQEEKARAGTQAGGRFIDTLVAQWMNRTGSNIPFQQAEEQAAESSNAQADKRQTQQSQESVIQSLKRKLKESQEAEASLSASLETEVRNREEIQTKVNATWVYIENITEYFNYIKESLASFQQHRDNLSNLYDSVILKQQEAIQKLQLNDARSKDLENRVAQLKNKSLLQEERLQEAVVEQNKLRKQLENSEYELQLQRNELTNAHVEEKLTLVKEQQRLVLEHENLQSRLQTIEKEKCVIAKSSVQLENKLLLEEKKVEEALTEQNKLKKQMENAEREFHSQKNELANAHAKEKKLLIEKQLQLELESQSLQSRLNMLEQDNGNITEIVAQRDALISKLQDEVSKSTNQLDIMLTKYEELNTAFEALTEKQNMRENELLTKTATIQNLEMMLKATKQREAGLINDVDKIDKKLTDEINYSKNLKDKLSNVQRDFQLAQEQNTELQQTLERTKSTNESANIDLQQQVKILQREKEEIMKRESLKVKNAETLYENKQSKHAEEVYALKNNYETRLNEFRKTIDHLNEVINDTKEETSVLNKSLTETKTENISLKSNCEFLTNRVENLQEKLNEATETKAENISLKSNCEFLTNRIENLQKKLKEATETKAENISLKSNCEFLTNRIENLQEKLKEATKTLQIKSFDDRKLTSEFAKTQHYVSPSPILNDIDELPSSQTLKRTPSQKTQNEQEAEITSVGRKFFKRPIQPQTYSKRRRA